jgi:hypothetical protein
MLKAIGSPLNKCQPIEEAILKKALYWMNDDLCRD